MSWGDGTGVPTSGSNLVIVGTDNKDLLHIRIFDAAGNRVTDTDETKLPAAQAAAIATLKQQLPGLLPPHVLTYAEKAQVFGEATSIVGQTQMRMSDPMGNALVELEGQFPFNFPDSTTQDPSGRGPLFGIGRTLYFCIPPNAKLLNYWDTVADRLFKIRHCQNIQGVARQLPLFDPPIDPGMLVKAAAAGIDVGSIVSGLNQPLGPVRSPMMIQKALELCAEVRSLGNALLSAWEKGDAEKLASLRQGHELALHNGAAELVLDRGQHLVRVVGHDRLPVGRAAGLARRGGDHEAVGVPDPARDDRRPGFGGARSRWTAPPRAAAAGPGPWRARSPR